MLAAVLLQSGCAGVCLTGLVHRTMPTPTPTPARGSFYADPSFYEPGTVDAEPMPAQSGPGELAGQQVVIGEPILLLLSDGGEARGVLHAIGGGLVQLRIGGKVASFRTDEVAEVTQF